MMENFNGAELRLARIFNGFALEEVAERVDKTRQYMHRLETGQAMPTVQLLAQLAAVLQVEPPFLTNVHTLMIEEDQFHFRKLFTTRAMIKQVAMARGELTGRLVTYLDKELRLPEIRIPDISDISSADDIERAAEQCRREWELGLGPITHMNRLAENVGAVITSFASVSKEIDALSVAVRRPIIVRNEAKESICRQRFDIGHELGHFVLHTGVVTGDRITEGQANRFSGALLIPRAMMAKLFPKLRGSRLDWQGISEFKLTWKVSKAAILYRARQLDLINDDQYRSGAITLRRTGEANGEREDHLIPVEGPEMLSRSLTLLADKKGIYAEDIACAMQVTPSFIRSVVGFDIPMRPQLQSSKTTPRPDLRLVG
ncbi:ImmA/IrrE family metallo-endopeptidase [Glaciimonas sp. PCH181]|uniref:helix-turn-helix domain-containing protein n=1 Tax=Glaciimonas sp. PCH181 TaxID=2133943 RepID=UPI000D39B367|nr:XRE family transcriptional regulator [Glaciimonas sp. PCH181]PUA17200.1 DNA-binding protein [Glaciimonas sp. PCH181]